MPGLPFYKMQLMESDEDLIIDNMPYMWHTNVAPSELWKSACLDIDFVDSNSILITPTKDDEKQARAIVFNTSSQPMQPETPGAALAVRRLLDRYDFSMADEATRLRTYAITRLLDLAESDKENIALSAVEKIGKIAEVGLFETKISIDVTKKSTEDLEKDLAGLLSKYMDSVKVING